MCVRVFFRFRGEEVWKGVSGRVALDRDIVMERRFQSRSMCVP